MPAAARTSPALFKNRNSNAYSTIIPWLKFTVNAQIMPKDSQSFGWIALQCVPDERDAFVVSPCHALR